MVNKKKWAIGYAVLCILYFVIAAAIPHDRLESRGLEGIGKPSLKLKTEEITDGTELRFDYQSDGQALSQLSFYFTADGKNLTNGIIRIEAYDARTDELLASEVYELAELGEEAFWGVTFTQEPIGRELTLIITGEDISEGPCVWLNTESQTEGSSLLNGTLLDQNLIYNAVYRTQVHYVRQPLLVTAMLAVLGGLFFLLTGRTGPEQQAATGAQSGAQREDKAPCRTGSRLRTAGQYLQSFYEKYRKLLGLGLLLLIVALVFYYVYDVQIRKAMNSTHREVVMKDNHELLPVTEDSREFVQYYTTEETELVGLGIRMDLSEDFAGEGVIHAEVRDVTEMTENTVQTEMTAGAEEDFRSAGILLCTADIDASTLLDGQYMGLIFDSSQKGIQGHTYEIRLEFSEELLDSGLSVIVTPEGYYQENTLYVNGKESENRLSMNAHTYFNLFLKKYFFGVFLFAEFTAAGFYYLTFLRRCRIEKVFVFTILCLGVIYNFTLTPYMTPDESYHIDMSYRHSNTLLGIESAGENKCFKREDDTQLEFTSNPSLENYKNIYDGLFTMVKNDMLVEADATSTTEAPMIIYLPAVLGMTLARLLHLGTVPMLLLGRWFSLLGFTVLTYFAMKKLPFGKSTLFLLAILPMNLQQCTSFSYDAVITGVSFLFICWCLSLVFGERLLKGTDMLGLGILGIILVYGKSGVYLPLALLIFLIPAERFGGKRIRNLCAAGLFLLPVLCFLNRNTVTVSYIAATTEATATVGSSTTAAYTISYFLSQPLELIRMLANTLSDKTSFYLESLVGQKMGWVEIEISEVISMLFWLLLILSALKPKEEPQFVRTGQKWWIAFVCAACAGVILAGMLLTWTPYGNISIEGVQGRYFIPFMPALMLLARNRRLVWERSPERGLLYAGFVGELLAVMYLIKAVLVL